jgi:Pectate lyase superfamily protein
MPTIAIMQGGLTTTKASFAQVAALIGSAAPGGDTINVGPATTVSTQTILSSIKLIRTSGYAVAGDRGEATYVRVVSQPTHAGKVQSLDGAWWEIVFPGAVNVLAFGADPTGAVASHTAIQNAIDYAIYSGLAVPLLGKGRVYIPWGIYKISDTIQVGYGENYHSVLIEGDGRKYRGANNFCGTVLNATFNDRPVFAVNGARENIIRWMTISGANAGWVYGHSLGSTGGASINDLLPANWVDNTFPASATARYTPYCAIAIDPYAGVAPAPAYPNVTFPSWTGIVAQYGKNFSTLVDIDGVEMIGFVTGVAIQPSNVDGNGDFVRMTRCRFEALQYGISIGQTQSRNVLVDNCQFLWNYAIVTTAVNGKQNGNPQILFNHCDLNGIIYAFDIPTMDLTSMVNIQSMYCEASYSLGRLGGGGSSTATSTFNACHFSMDWTARGVPNYLLDCTLSNTGARFNTCTFRANPVATVFQFGGDPRSYEFNNCLTYVGIGATLNTTKYATNATAGITVGVMDHKISRFHVKAQQFFNLNTGASNGQRDVTETCYESNRQTCIPIHCNRAICQAQGSDPGILLDHAFNAINKAGRTITTTLRVVTFDITGSGYNTDMLNQRGGWPGDVCIDSTTGCVFFVTGLTGNVITMQAQNGYAASGALLTAIGATGTLYFFNSRRYTPTYVTYSTMTAANASLTAVQRDDTYAAYGNDVNDGFPVGDFIYSDSTFDNIIPIAGSNITVNAGLATITCGGNFTYSRTHERLAKFIRPAPANGT